MYMVIGGFSLQNNKKAVFEKSGIFSDFGQAKKKRGKKVLQNPVGLSRGIYNIHKQYSSFIQTLL